MIFEQGGMFFRLFSVIDYYSPGPADMPWGLLGLAFTTVGFLMTIKSYLKLPGNSIDNFFKIDGSILNFIKSVGNELKTLTKETKNKLTSLGKKPTPDPVSSQLVLTVGLVEWLISFFSFIVPL